MRPLNITLLEKIKNVTNSETYVSLVVSKQ